METDPAGGWEGDVGEKSCRGEGECVWNRCETKERRRRCGANMGAASSILHHPDTCRQAQSRGPTVGGSGGGGGLVTQHSDPFGGEAEKVTAKESPRSWGGRGRRNAGSAGLPLPDLTWGFSCPVFYFEVNDGETL